MLSPDDRPKKKSKAKAKRNEDIFDPENEIDSPVIKFTGSTRAFNTTEIDSLRTENSLEKLGKLLLGFNAKMFQAKCQTLLPERMR